MISKELEHYDFINYSSDTEVEDNLSFDDVEYDVYNKETEVQTLTVEFTYNEDVPLSYLLKDVSEYIKENGLDMATIHSIYTTLDVEFDFVLVVTFEIYDD